MVYNINNLTKLWQLIGNKFNTLSLRKYYSSCYVENSGWPNRVWSDSVNNDESFKEISDIMISNSNTSVFSFFSSKEELEMKNFIIQKYFHEKSTQYGMEKVLDEVYEINTKIELVRVTNINDAELWCTTFYQSFRYLISEETVAKSLDEIEYFIIKKEGIVAGTVMLFITDKTVGIHSLGIIPDMRGKGVAMDAMKVVLNNATKMGYKLAVLQASEMAKNMYLKLGFEEKYLLKNYINRR